VIRERPLSCGGQTGCIVHPEGADADTEVTDDLRYCIEQKENEAAFCGVRLLSLRSAIVLIDGLCATLESVA
jgi:hypothetical protein